MRFNALPRAEAEAELLTCCASPRWAASVAGGRPYGSTEGLLAAAGKAVRDLDWPDVDKALCAHPGIGECLDGHGQGRAARSSQWSRDEQSGIAEADREAFAEGNAAYYERFGHVFLICTSGRSAEEMLSELRERMTNDPADERTVVHGELVKITELRLRKLFT